MYGGRRVQKGPLRVHVRGVMEESRKETRGEAPWVPKLRFTPDRIQASPRRRSSASAQAVRTSCMRASLASGGVNHVNLDAIRMLSRIFQLTDTVETRVTLGQLSNLSSLFDRESPRSIRSLQILEPVDRDTRCSGGELQQTRLQ